LSLVGLLSVQPGHGTSVSVSAGEFLEKPLRWGMAMNWREKLDELVEARIAIEQAIVGMAAERATAEDLQGIESHHNQLKAARKSGRKAIQADLAFHAALAQASHNSVLTRFLAEIRQPLRRWMEQKANLFWDYDVVFEQHGEILGAIEAHDIKKAQSALRRHLESAGKRFKEALLEKHSK
jgi:GntR family transcriptional repressor for pyruvate dehydrogenase complex